MSRSEAGELACLVVSPEAQDGGYGELLLEHLLANARARGIRRLFALSTHTGEWFIERGFQAAAVADLPEERQHDTTKAAANRKCLFTAYKPKPFRRPIYKKAAIH